jgi:tRNA (mo5U34)-methyltransferase
MPADRRSWYHTIEFDDGTATPGYFDTRGIPALVDWPLGLTGGRCLDVGTFDGFWAFEMERRGAKEVVALDVDDPEVLDWSYDEAERGPELVREWGAERGPGFRETAARLGSSVQRVNRSVYDLDPEVDGTFDVVFCGALLLHLREPVRALEAMRSVCHGELVLVETVDPVMDIVARRVPAARFHPDWDQWWRVNSAGLVEMTRTAGFEVVWVSDRILVPYGTGNPDRPPARIHSLAALRPRQRGVLHRAVRGRPRPRQPREPRD